MVFSILLILIFLVALLFAWGYLEKRTQKRKANQFLEKVFSATGEFPALEIGSSYGWPTFHLRFRSREAFKQAMTEKRVESFEALIAEMIKDHDFDAKLAVTTSFDSEMHNE